MATTVTVGQYAISECVVKVKTADSTFSPIADLEEFNINVETNVETWYSINDGGWQNALATAKALSGSFSGKRTLGDAGNDFIDSLRLNIGKKAEADFEIDFPNGDTLGFTSVVALTDWLGGATGVAPLRDAVNNKFEPTLPATRAECAVIIHNAMNAALGLLK